MNAPMQSIKPIKTIYGRSAGLKVSDKTKRLMIGAEIVWFDNNPLSQDMDDCLHFFFDSHTNPMTDLLLRKQGLTDVSQYVNIRFFWRCEMSTHWNMPNRPDHRHEDSEVFKFRGTIFPMTKAFKENRDRIYMRQRLEYLDIPDDNRNKKVYATTKFKCVVVGA
jgi:hypothetical protein